jgi:hypothetical protein
MVSADRNADYQRTVDAHRARLDEAVARRRALADPARPAPQAPVDRPPVEPDHADGDAPPVNGDAPPVNGDAPANNNDGSTADKTFAEFAGAAADTGPTQSYLLLSTI